MSEDFTRQRRKNPRAMVNVIRGAGEIHCSICNTTPCYLLSTAAIAVLQEQLNMEENLVGAVRYKKALDRLQACVTRHIEILSDEYNLDEHFRVTPEVLDALEVNGKNVEKLEAELAEEEELGD